MKKLYYSISEVSEATGLDTYVLRYWETEFPQLAPKKNRSGHRIYTEDDIALVRRIQHLLKVEKYTIEGARQVLARDKQEAADREDLMKVRVFLEKLLHRL